MIVKPSAVGVVDIFDDGLALFPLRLKFEQLSLLKSPSLERLSSSSNDGERIVATVDERILFVVIVSSAVDEDANLRRLERVFDVPRKSNEKVRERERVQDFLSFV